MASTPSTPSTTTVHPLSGETGSNPADEPSPFAPGFSPTPSNPACLSGSLPLPRGWMKVVRQGRPVYANSIQRSTQWAHPLAPNQSPPPNQPRSLPEGIILPEGWKAYDLDGLICYRNEQLNLTIWDLQSIPASNVDAPSPSTYIAEDSSEVTDDDFVLIGNQPSDQYTSVTRPPNMPTVVKMTILHLLEPDLKTWRKRKAVLYNTGALCFYPVRFEINNQTWLEYIQVVSILRNVCLSKGQTAFSPPKPPTIHCAFWTPRELSLLTGPQARNEALTRAHEVTYTSYQSPNSKITWDQAIKTLKLSLLARMQSPGE